MIVASLYVTAGAIIVGVPIGILCAVFLARFCPARLYKVIKPAINLMAGIPSIVYGFFGLVVIVPVMQDIFPGTSGKSILTASILLGIMILPTIISVSESALRAVPESYHEGALALGATNERSSFTVILPAAKSGITAGVILGIGRAIGETMAVVMIAGNQAVIPGVAPRGRANTHGERRAGNGLRPGPAPGSAHRHGRGAVRVHPHHQPVLLPREKKGVLNAHQ